MDGRPNQHPIRRAVIIIIAAVGVSALAAVIIIWFAGLTGSTAWAVVAGLLAVLLVSLIIGLLLLRRDVFGPLMVFGLAAFFSLTWLYPGFGGVRPDPVAAIEWIARPDGSRLALHVTRASATTQPPIIAVHGGPGVADMAHDAPAFAPLATDRNVYVNDRVCQRATQLGRIVQLRRRDRARDHFRTLQDHRSDHVGHAGCAPP
jgi:hypothetical protein